MWYGKILNGSDISAKKLKPFDLHLKMVYIQGSVDTGHKDMV